MGRTAAIKLDIDFWDSKRGFPQSNIYCIQQSAEGYLLLGTQEGLWRFDGVTFRSISRQFALDPSLDFVKDVHEDRQGNLWLGTLGGVAKIVPGEMPLVFNTANGLSGNRIECLHEADDGSIWVGSDRGVDRILGEAIVRTPLLERIPRESVKRIVSDGRGSMWIAYSNLGLLQIEGEVVRRYSRANGLSSDHVYSLCPDRRGGLWIGTDTHLDYFQGGIFSHYDLGSGLPSDIQIKVVSVYQDGIGIVWTGTENGLYRLQDGQFEHFSAGSGLSSDYIYSFFEDREGSLWIGTIGGGLIQFKQKKVSVYSMEDGLARDKVFCIYKDSRQQLWVGSEGGVDRMDGERLISYSAILGVKGQSILSISEEASGSLLLGTFKGLVRASSGESQRVKAIGDFPVNCIFRDRQERQWISVYDQGVYLLRGDDAIFLNRSHGLLSLRVNCFAQDPMGKIWVGLEQGIQCFDESGQSFTTPAIPDLRLSYNAIYPDPAGNLWLGTSEGLKMLGGGRLTSFSAKEGLSSISVESILVDDRDRLWLGTKGGITQVSRGELLDVSTGKRETVKAISFTEREGLKSRYCNGPGLVTGRRDDLKLWFPTISGLAQIQPAQLKSNTIAPPVHIEEVTADGAILELTRDGIRPIPKLEPGLKRIEFRFTAISLFQPEKVRFKYRLEGYDRGWIGEGSQRTATYTNIPPGSYTFQVIACNNDGIWNQKGDSFSFRLIPYFWQRPIFFVILGLLIISFVFTSIFLRTRALELRKRVLEERVREKTAELGEANRVLQELNVRVSKANDDLENVNRQLRTEIVEKERAQQALSESNEKLKQLDNLKTEFINMVSHELRTPLTSVVGFAKMIRKKQEEQIYPQLPAGNPKMDRAVRQTKKDIDIIISEGERLTSMINDLLDTAKLESGKFSWSMEVIQVRDIIRSAVAFTSSLFEQKRLPRKIQIEEKLPPVIGDRERLIQVLINLLSNAVKFTSEGIVTCSARVSPESSQAKTGSFIEVSVSDTGIGIAPEYVEKLFDKFVQLRQGERSFMKGTGLGLSICKQIVEFHGGRIWIKSRENQGSTFFFTLPVAK